jgi:hypothetical protein
MLPEKVVCVYIHDPLFCLDGDKIDSICPKQYLKTDVALLFHYRFSIFSDKTYKDTNSSQDTTMWKYKDDLILGVNRILNETGFKP